MVGEVAARAADDPARLGRRHGRPHARLRPRLPPHHAARARPLAADRRRAAPRRVVPADLRLPRSATCTSSATATTACRSPSRSGARTSTPTSPRCGRGSGPARRCGSPTSRSRTTSGCSTSACRSTRELHARVRPSDPWDYGRLAEGVEAWGFRVMQERREYMDREEVARLWFEEDFLPVVETLRAGGFIRSSETRGATPTCASSPPATSCCARTSGAARCSTACRASSGAAAASASMPAPRAAEAASRGRASPARRGGRRRATARARAAAARRSSRAPRGARAGRRSPAKPGPPLTLPPSASTSTSPSTTTRCARSCTSWSWSCSPAGRWIAIVRDSPRDECRICGWCGCTSSVRRSQCSMARGTYPLVAALCLVAQARDRLADEARDVHLRDADALRRSPTA